MHHTLPIGKNQLEQNKFLIRKQRDHKEVAQYFECLKKRTVNPESYIQLKYPSGMKGKTTHS